MPDHGSVPSRKSAAGFAGALQGDVRFVLVEPRSAGNVGAAARGLKNLGFSRLAVVRPACDATGPAAQRMAVDAADVLERLEVHDDLDAALRGAATVAGTSRRTGRHRRPHFPLDAFAPELAGLAAAAPAAIVFGREDRGLSDDELDRCTHLVHLSASRDYPSFNLAQAVLLVAWELRRSAAAPRAAAAGDPPAQHGERESMYAHLERALVGIGFLHGESVEAVMRRFRRLFGRAAITADEVRMIRGLARQMQWAADRAALAAGHDPETARTDRRGP
jgi:TrmH family RNA methyltransferase